jgi:hypothetical protein
MLKDENKHVQNAARQALAQLDQKNAETYLKKLRIEQQQWLRDAKSQLKFAVDSAKLVQRTQLAQLMINDPQARMQLLREKNGYQKFSVVIRNSSQQAYLRQLIRMHLAYSVMKNPPPDAVDWVSDQISDSDVEAVPALVEGLNLGLKYKLGFV